MFVGAYWPQRKESREQVAARIARFLSEVGSTTEWLSKWYVKARSAASARTPLATDTTSVANELKANRRDIGGDVMSELGFNIGVWNGDSASLAATIGAYSSSIQNSVVLSIEDEQPPLRREDWRDLLRAAINAFNPEHAVVTSNERLKHTGATNPWEAGWLMYQRGGEIEQSPFE